MTPISPEGSSTPLRTSFRKPSHNGFASHPGPRRPKPGTAYDNVVIQAIREFCQTFARAAASTQAPEARFTSSLVAKTA